jgi:hypothetical protein
MGITISTERAPVTIPQPKEKTIIDDHPDDANKPDNPGLPV